MRLGTRGAALVEFALAWPLAVLFVMVGVQVAVSGAEWSAAHSAAAAGARAASAAGAVPADGAVVALHGLTPALAGATAEAWCPGQPAPPQVWVCARDLGRTVDVSIGGSVPALVPLFGAAGLPIGAEVTLQKETFAS